MSDVSATQPDAASDEFFESAYRRIIGILVALLPCLVVLFWFLFDHRFAAGFLVGGAFSIVNLLSLKKLVITFADRVINSAGQQRSSGLVVRFVLRYGLVAGVGYAIFKSSAMSAYGLVAGLALPAAAIMTEAAYELYTSMRHGR